MVSCVEFSSIFTIALELADWLAVANPGPEFAGSLELTHGVHAAEATILHCMYPTGSQSHLCRITDLEGLPNGTKCGLSPCCPSEPLVCFPPPQGITFNWWTLLLYELVAMAQFIFLVRPDSPGKPPDKRCDCPAPVCFTSHDDCGIQGNKTMSGFCFAPRAVWVGLVTILCFVYFKKIALHHLAKKSSSLQLQNQ